MRGGNQWERSLMAELMIEETMMMEVVEVEVEEVKFGPYA